MTKWSGFQEAIFEDVADGTSHTVVMARAGSGKTSTIVEALRHLPDWEGALLLAFNKDIATELAARVPRGVMVKTFHAFGFGAIISAFGKPEVDARKMDAIAEEVLGSDRNSFDLRRSLCKAASLAKNTLASELDELDALLDQFDIDVGESFEERREFIEALQRALEMAKEDRRTIDFDDMVWFPCVHNLRPKKFSRVFVDETQDLNAPQVELALKACTQDGRILAVGDNRQAIYQWRGAGDDSMDALTKRLGARVLPLSVTYRCARSIVAEVKHIVPDLEAAPGAPEGEVLRGWDVDKMLADVRPGDFILSRANAPLLGLCLKLIRADKPAIVQGRDIGIQLATLVKKSKAYQADAFLEWLEAWGRRERARLIRKDRPTEAVTDRVLALEALADGVDTTQEILARIDRLFSDVADKARIILSTTHRCVSPSTYVETDEGLRRIADIGPTGVIATAEGAAKYKNLVRYEKRKMLRLTTKSGYSVEVTTDHGMMAWDSEAGAYVRRDAARLRVGDLLRLRLGSTIDVADAELPQLPGGDVRAKRFDVPSTVTQQAAEFFGLMVADGTIFKAGFRLKKRHADVAHRFADLARELFGYRCEVTRGQGTFDAEVCSVLLGQWLLQVSGMAPLHKHVPSAVLRSSLRSQAAFLRGLFEDGTVNVADGRLDHLNLTTKYPAIAKVVQVMLLRLGVIASRKLRFGYWRVEVYGANAHKFRDVVGFVSEYKNSLLGFPTGLEEGYIVPVTRARLCATVPDSAKAKRAVCNGRQRGYVSRAGAALIGGFDDELRFHHDRVVEIARFVGPAMCVEVPRVGRFLQDGFDGCNSKGLERERVYVLADTYKRRNREGENLYYVACTRAMTRLVLVSGGVPEWRPRDRGAEQAVAEDPQPAAAGGWPADDDSAALPELRDLP